MAAGFEGLRACYRLVAGAMVAHHPDTEHPVVAPDLSSTRSSLRQLPHFAKVGRQNRFQSARMPFSKLCLLAFHQLFWISSTVVYFSLNSGAPSWRRRGWLGQDERGAS